ncbi:MAG: DUF1993 domain-containing protein [Gammaproteobacteria bacterium]|nr:MAG: DUF1993 domain-containing protein [Gammaproteobacteria bacterium]
MNTPMYDASIPVMLHMLANLKKILAKAERHAARNKIDPGVFMNARLAPDMYPLTRQIQIASDTAKGCAGRLADKKIPVYKDNEKSFKDLYKRIDKTVAFLKTCKPHAINGSEDRTIVMQFPSMTLKFSGMDYLHRFALPNFYFHVTTAYAILRHNGVNIGKRDFIGRV